MSDNPSDSQQQAVAQTEKSAKKMTASSTGNELDGSVSTSPERTEGSNGSEEDKHKDEDVVTTKQKADAAEALAAVADAVSTVLHWYSMSSLSYLFHSAHLPPDAGKTIIRSLST